MTIIFKKKYIFILLPLCLAFSGCSTEEGNSSVWPQNSYYLFLHNNNGSDEPTTTISFNKISDINLLPPPEKEGYSFDDWYLDPEFSQPFSKETFEGLSINYADLYAKYTINQYKITYHNDIDNIVYYDYNSKVEPLSLSEEGYSFDGWYLDSQYIEKANIEYMPAKNLDFYPKFNTKQFRVNFLNTKYEPLFSNIVKTYREMMDLVMPTPVLEGHNFLGWYLDIGCTIAYDKNNLNNLGEFMNLYAKFEIANYKIRFHVGENVDECEYEYNSLIKEMRIAEPNCNLSNWYTDDNYTNLFTSEIMPGHDVDLYARECNHVWANESSHGLMRCELCSRIDIPNININVDTEITTEYTTGNVSVSSSNSSYSFVDQKCDIKIRGNGTATMPKKPYRLKFDKKQKMLGLNNDLKAKSWVLLAEWKGDFVKTALGLELAKRIYDNNYYSSDYCYVEVFINNEYNGLYILAEQNQVNSGRINITEPEKNSDNTDIGYFIEMDYYYYTEENYFSVDYGNSIYTSDGEELTTENMVNYYTIKSDIYADAQKEYIQKVTNNIYNIIYDALYNDHTDTDLNPYLSLDDNGDIIEDNTISTAKEAISNHVDYNSLIKSFLIQEIVEDYDIGWSSFYLTYDAGPTGDKKMVFECPWDFDIGFGGADFDKTDSLYLFSKSNTWHQYYNPWFMIFANCDWFLEDLSLEYASILNDNIIQSIIGDSYVTILQYKDSLYGNYLLWQDSYGEQIQTKDLFEKDYYAKVLKIYEFLLNKQKILTNILL